MNKSENKIIGVAVDNYKLNKFKKTITKKGFTIKEVLKFNKDVQVIQVDCPIDKIHQLKTTLEQLQRFFKQRN